MLHVASLTLALTLSPWPTAPRGRALYPTSKALDTGHLAVGGVHSLYYEVHGNANGAPALFLHGGPGAGCFARHAGFFDPACYKVVLFDQRGCGKSSPRGELRENDTPHLVSDCEALRAHLGIERWSVVLGGSWGVTLALAYVNEHPCRIAAVVLRAVCLMRQREIRWLFAPSGVGQMLPEAWSQLASHRQERLAKRQATAGVEETDADNDEDATLRWYAHALSGAEPGEVAGAASAWARWEMSVYGLSGRLAAERLAYADDEGGETAAEATWAWHPPSRQWSADGRPLASEDVAGALGNGFYERVASEICRLESSPAPAERAKATAGAVVAVVAGAASSAKSKLDSLRRDSPYSRWGGGGAGTTKAGVSVAPPGMAAPSATGPPSPPPGGFVPAQARLTSHYSVARGFLDETELLHGAAATCREWGIRCIAVQGGNDLICPPSTAYELHQVWPEMELRVVSGGGHSMYGALQAEVLAATDALRDAAKLSCDIDRAGRDS